MRFRSMNTAVSKRDRRSPQRKALPQWPGLHMILQACDEFMELRRERGSSGTHRLVAGCATIGGHRILVLIHCQSAGGEKLRTVKSAQRRASEFRKCRHVIDLARKFKQPLLVCIVDPPAPSGRAAAGWHDVLELPEHLLSQWLLDVPIVLAVLTKRSSCNLFGSWLADQSLALEGSQFVFLARNRESNHRYRLDAERLVRDRIIDKTVPGRLNPASPVGTVMSYRLKRMLGQILGEVQRIAPDELRVRREQKLARIEAMVASMCGAEN